MLKRLIPLILILSVVVPLYPTPKAIALADPDADSNSMIRVYSMNFESEVYDKVSQNRYKNFIIKLTENGSRWTSAGPTFSDANVYARNWLVKRLGELSSGKIEVELIGNHKSVVGRLPGWVGGNSPVIMIGGHYDSVALAPGANDDGTGVATVLELAYVLSKYEWPLDIYFCAWNSEEIGLVGSHEVAAQFSSSGIQILQYFNVDMLLVENGYSPPDERVLMVYNNDPRTIYETSHYWADLTRMMSRNLGRDLILPLASNSFSAWSRSDHYSFLTYDYQGVLFAFESGSGYDSAYHSPSDTWDNSMYNYTLAHETVASIGASIAHSMSRAYGEPTRINYTGIIEEGVRKYYIANTIETTMNLTLTWQNGPLSVDVRSPSEVLLHHLDIVNSSGNNKKLISLELVDDGLHEIIFSSENEVEFSFEAEYESDIEGDDIPDSEQYWFDVELFTIDHDADGLSDAEEMILGTDIWSRDTDGDAMEDFWEVENGFDPLSPSDGLEDEDGDGISNTNEARNGTSVFNNDTDLDLMPDLYEIVMQLNPLIDDSSGDADSDLVTNYNEYILGTNPQLSDSEGDLMPDGYEIANSLNPLVDDSFLDPDGDTLTNLEEFLIGTSPQSDDSDSDTMPDNYEVERGLNPIFDDSADDLDDDALTNKEEYELGTSPINNDTDSDLMPDGWEVTYHLKPLVNDSLRDPDKDGITNLDEYLNGLNPRVSDRQVVPIIIATFSIGLVAIVIPAAIAWKKLEAG